MQFIKIGIKFANQQACDEWEEKNIPDQKYMGMPVMMVMHSETFGTDEVILDEIITV